MDQRGARIWFVGYTGLVLGLSGLGLWLLFAPDEMPEDLGEVPAFTLVNQYEEELSDADLRGQVVVASFIFTRCFAECPLLVQRQSLLHEKVAEAGLADDVTMISFTVDPEYDTPEVLRDYGERRNLPEHGTWHLLTGAPSYVEDVIVEGFYFGVQPVDGQDNEHDAPVIMHTVRFVLVDGDGRIRDRPNGMEGDLDEMLETIRLLASR